MEGYERMDPLFFQILLKIFVKEQEQNFIDFSVYKTHFVLTAH